jgi:hypothetical protein
MILYGLRPFGRVDEIPGLGHVETTFFHVWFVPLLPLGSTFTMAGGNVAPELHVDQDPARGFPLGLRFKSVLCAWLRAALHFGVVAWGAVAWYDGRVAVGVAAIVAGILGSLVLGRLARSMSATRRQALAREVGFSADDLEVAAERATFL